jgi:hypothetical protein
LYQNGVVKTTFKQMKRFLERRRDGYLTDRSTQQNIRMELARLGNLAAFDNATQRQNRKDEP